MVKILRNNCIKTKILFNTFFILTVFILFSAVAFANISLIDDVDLVRDELIGQEVVSPLDVLFGNENINLFVILNNGSNLDLNLVTDDGFIDDLGLGSLKNPTLNVYTDEDTFDEICNSPDPVSEINDALDNDYITYEAVGMTSSIKYGSVSVLRKLFGFLL